MNVLSIERTKLIFSTEVLLQKSDAQQYRLKVIPFSMKLSELLQLPEVK